MAPAQPPPDNGKPPRKPTTKTAKPTPRRPPGGRKEPHALANKRRLRPKDSYDIPVSAVVESKILGAGWDYRSFAAAINVTADLLYRARANRVTWPAWLLHDVAVALGTTVDAIEILAGVQSPRSTLRQAIESSVELDDRARAVLIETFEQLAIRRDTSRRTGGDISS